MNFHWLRDCKNRKYFSIIWGKGSTNTTDYFTKHHTTKHHKVMRPKYIRDKDVVQTIIQSEYHLLTLQGCINLTQA